MKKFTHIPYKTLKKILAGKLNQEQQAEWESFLKENPFEKEAFEGLQMLSEEELEQDLEEIRNTMSGRVQTKVLSYRAIAASVALLLASVALVVYFMNFFEANPHTNANASKSAEKVQEQKAFGMQTEEISPNQIEKESKLITKQENTLPQTENTLTPNTSKKSLDLQYIEEEKTKTVISKQDEATEELKEIDKIENENSKTKEDEFSGLEEQSKMLENTPPKEASEAAQTEKPEKLSADKAKKQSEKRKERRRAGAAAPQENRALNISREETNSNFSVVLQGQVLDAQAKQPLKNAKILLKGYSQSTQTDSLGNFSFSVPKLSKYVLLIEAPHYAQAEAEVNPNQKNLLYLNKK